MWFASCVVLLHYLSFAPEWIPPPNRQSSVLSGKGGGEMKICFPSIDWFFPSLSPLATFFPPLNVTEINKSFCCAHPSLLMLCLFIIRFIFYCLSRVKREQHNRERRETENCWTISSIEMKWGKQKRNSNFFSLLGGIRTTQHETVINNDDDTDELSRRREKKVQLLFELLVICSGELKVFLVSISVPCCCVCFYFHSRVWTFNQCRHLFFSAVSFDVFSVCGWNNSLRWWWWHKWEIIQWKKVRGLRLKFPQFFPVNFNYCLAFSSLSSLIEKWKKKFSKWQRQKSKFVIKFYDDELEMPKVNFFSCDEFRHIKSQAHATHWRRSRTFARWTSRIKYFNNSENNMIDSACQHNRCNSSYFLPPSFACQLHWASLD